MKNIIIIVIFYAMVNPSLCKCKTKIELTQTQWDVYIQAVQAVSPFIHKGEKIAIFGILEAATNGYVSNQPMPFLIYTSGKRLYTRTPENWLKDKKIPEQNIRQEDVFKRRNNVYQTNERLNMPILTNLIIEGRNYEQSIFDLEQYPINFILNEEVDNDIDFGYFNYSLGDFFYAIVDEDGKFHGVTFLRYGDSTPYNRRYYLNLGFDYMMNIWADKNLVINYSLFDNYVY